MLYTPAWTTSAKKSQPQKMQNNQLKWKRQKNSEKWSRRAIRWEVLIVSCTSQLLPVLDLCLTCGEKSKSSAQPLWAWCGGRRGWAEVQSASFVLAPELTLSPPSPLRAVVIAACDLFPTKLSFSSDETLEGLSNSLLHAVVTLQSIHVKYLKRKPKWS